MSRLFLGLAEDFKCERKGLPETLNPAMEKPKRLSHARSLSELCGFRVSDLNPTL